MMIDLRAARSILFLPASNPRAITKAREAGAAAYLAKPYSPRELLQMILQPAPES